MHYITVLTPDNIEIEYRLAGPGARIAAAVVDLCLQAAVLIAVLLLYFFIALGGQLSGINTFGDLGWGLAFLIAAFFIIFYGYGVFTELVFDGRTIGKRLFKLRAIRENGMPVSWPQSLIRNIFKLTVDILGIGVVTIMFSKKCKRFGDMAASTIVISENPRQISLDSLSVPVTSDTLFNAYGENFRLSEGEKRVLREYFSRRDTFSDKGESAKKALVRYFAEKFSLPEEKLNEAVLYRIFRLNS